MPGTFEAFVGFFFFFLNKAEIYLPRISRKYLSGKSGFTVKYFVTRVASDANLD